MKKLIKFMVTAFRDGFQSAYGARVLTKDFLPAVEAAVRAGMHHFEAGGGARFQSLYFYCNEDAFDMMDAFRQTAGKDANLQTLARGTNVVGLDSQPRDIIRLHAQLFKRHGITTIRNFDALNDVQNLVYSGQCIVDAGLKHEVCVTMMGLPPGLEGSHTAEYYTQVLRSFLDSDVPYDSLCFKDASGTAPPQLMYQTVLKARQLIGEDKPIICHTHETAGIGVAAYKAGLAGGASSVDLSMAPVSGGTCQPDILTMWHAIRDMGYVLDVDVHEVRKAERVFRDCMEDYFVPPESQKVEPLIQFSPMPGGALTANTQMLRDNGLMDRYPEIITEMGEAVPKGGFGTSVTPVSQFYFQQAFNNVMFGKWKKIAEGYGKMVLGYFGKTPIPADSQVVQLAQEQLGLPPTDRNPLDINDEDPTKGVAPAKKALEDEGLPITDENIFIAATCKEKGIAFLKGEAKENIRKEAKGATPATTKAKGEGEGDGSSRLYEVRVNNRLYKVEMDGQQAKVNGKAYDITISDGPVPQDNGDGKSASSGGSGNGLKSHSIQAPLPGIILRFQAKVGDEVQAGAPLVVLESMKMETPINAPANGKVTRFAVSQGDQVQAGQLVAELEG